MNTKVEAELLIEAVCNHFEFERSLLYKKKGLKPIRLAFKQVNRKKVKTDLSLIKMCLAYLITRYSAIPMDVIGPMVGYSDHSTIPYIKRKINIYLEIQDEKFLRYWIPINEIADSIGFKKDLIRQSMIKVIHMIAV